MDRDKFLQSLLRFAVVKIPESEAGSGHFWSAFYGNEKSQNWTKSYLKPRPRKKKLREKAKNLEATIEPRLLTAFKRIRRNSRNGLGIVYVQRDACGGCFNKIPPQRQLDIRMRKKIIVCEYCGRIMIDPELAGVEVEDQKEKPKRRLRARRTDDEA